MRSWSSFTKLRDQFGKGWISTPQSPLLVTRGVLWTRHGLRLSEGPISSVRLVKNVLPATY